MGIEEDILLKNKTWELKRTFSQKQKKTHSKLDEKNLPFHDAHDHFVFRYISTACLRRCLPNVIKDHRN